MNVVSDASPIIALSSIDRLVLLKRLFGRVFVPTAVEMEVRTERRKDFRDGKEEGWIVVRRVVATGTVERLRTRLGAGEAEAISLAVEMAEPLLLLDDKLARRMARSRGLRVAGTLGMLVIASDKGLITDLASAIARLADGGFWFSDHVVREALSSRKAHVQEL